MGCLEDLQAVLLQISGQIGAMGGCGCTGSGGAGYTSAPAETFIDDGVEYPAGYASRAAYDTAKCDLARFILDRLAGDFGRLAVANVAGKTASTLATTLPLLLLTPIPFDEMLVGVAAGVFALVALGIGVYTDAMAELQARIEAMDICDLYDAGDVDAALQALEDWIDAGTYTTQALTAALGKALVTINSVNPLFAGPPGDINLDQLPAGDCSGCGAPECEKFFVDPSVPEQWGVKVSETEWSVTIDQDEPYTSNRHDCRVTLNWDSAGGTYCGDALRLVSVELIAGTWSDIGNMLILYNQAGGYELIVQSNPTGTTNVDNVAHIECISGNPFTVRLTFSEIPE